MKVPLLIKVYVSDLGEVRIEPRFMPETRECVLAAGEYAVTVDVEARPASLAEIAEATYKETVNFETVAAAVVEEHERRKAAR